MTRITPNVNESSATTLILGYQPTDQSATETSGWILCAHKLTMRTVPASAAHADDVRSIHNLIRRREQIPARKAALERTRKKIGASLKEAEGVTLTSLRLSKGLSQAQLAELIGQSQPYVARLEKERQDLRGKTIKKLATALGVSADTIIRVTQPDDDHA